MKTLLERVTAGADELRQQRARNSVEMAAESSRSEIAKYKNDLLNGLNKIENLLDLGETSTTSIAENLKDFNPTKWAEELYGRTLVNIIESVQNINIRIKIHNSLFPEHAVDEINGKTFSSDIIEFIVGNNSTAKKK